MSEASRAWYYRHRAQISAQRKSKRCERREYERNYYASHRDACRQKNKRYYERHKEKIIEKAKEYRRSDKGVTARRERDKRPDVKSKKKKKDHVWYVKNKEYVLLLSKVRYSEIEKRCREDAGFYAAYRKKARVNKAKRCIKEGRCYKPLIGCRIPDYAKKGEFLFTAMPRTITRGEICQNGLRYW